jgi:hypothetical protein
MPGGRGSSISQGGHRFDLGPTIVTVPQGLRELWSACGRDFDRDVDLRALDPFYEIRWQDGSSFTARQSTEAMRAEVARLRALVAAQAAALKTAQAEAAAAKAGLLVKSLEIEKLKIQIARLRRMQFGRSSEKLSHEIEQLELRLEELEMVEAANNAAIDEIAPAADAATAKPKATRRPLPEHLPRIEIVHTPAIVNDPACACPSCGTAGKWRKVDEDVREVLEYVPGRFEVIRHVRPAFSCRTCESMAQAPMPSMPIERGF